MHYFVINCFQVTFKSAVELIQVKKSIQKENCVHPYSHSTFSRAMFFSIINHDYMKKRSTMHFSCNTIPCRDKCSAYGFASVFQSALPCDCTYTSVWEQLEHSAYKPTPCYFHTVWMDLPLCSWFTRWPRFVRVGAVFHYLTWTAFSFAVVGKELFQEQTEHISDWKDWFNDTLYSSELQNSSMQNQQQLQVNFSTLHRKGLSYKKMLKPQKCIQS